MASLLFNHSTSNLLRDAAERIALGYEDGTMKSALEAAAICSFYSMAMQEKSKKFFVRLYPEATAKNRGRRPFGKLDKNGRELRTMALLLASEAAKEL